MNDEVDLEDIVILLDNNIAHMINLVDKIKLYIDVDKNGDDIIQLLQFHHDAVHDFFVESVLIKRLLTDNHLCFEVTREGNRSIISVKEK